MDRRSEVRVSSNTRPEITREIQKSKAKKGLGEQLIDWVDTIMPDRF